MSSETQAKRHWRTSLPSYVRIEYEYVVYDKPVEMIRPQVPLGRRRRKVVIKGKTIARIFLHPTSDVADAMGYSYVSASEPVWDFLLGRAIARGRAEKDLATRGTGISCSATAPKSYEFVVENSLTVEQFTV